MFYLTIIVLIIFAFLYVRNPVYFARLLLILIVSAPPLYALVTEGIGGLMVIIKIYAVIIPIGLIVVGISNIDDGVSSLRGKYFDNKTIYCTSAGTIHLNQFLYVVSITSQCDTHKQQKVGELEMCLKLGFANKISTFRYFIFTM